MLFKIVPTFREQEPEEEKLLQYTTPGGEIHNGLYHNGELYTTEGEPVSNFDNYYWEYTNKSLPNSDGYYAYYKSIEVFELADGNYLVIGPLDFGEHEQLKRKIRIYDVTGERLR